MPLYQYVCDCGNKFTEIFPMASRPDTAPCPLCGETAKYRISVSSADCFSERPSWISSVADIVDPSTGHAAKEFYNNRTRENYQNFMRASGKRHIEPGEPVGWKPKPTDLTPVKKRLADQLRKERRIEIG